MDYQTIGDTSAADNALFFAFAQGGALVALFVGAAILSLMRLRTGSLVAPITFHWLAVVALNATLFVLSR